MKNLISIDEHVKKFKDNAAEAARALDVDYQTYIRWLRRKTFACEHSAYRKLMAAQGIDLPRRAK